MPDPSDPTRFTSRPAQDIYARHPVLGDVRAYWEGLRRGPRLPRRSDLDPRQIESALPYAFVLERVAPGVSRFRVAGAHLSDLMGMEVRGMPVQGIFDPRQRGRVLPLLDAVFTAPQAVALSLEDCAGAGGVRGQMLVLPLLDDTDQVTRAFGCLITQGTPARVPCRLRMCDSHVTALAGPDSWRDIPAPAPRPVIAGFSEKGAGFAPAEMTAAHPAPKRVDVPYLRVVK